jgi:hypothetical protein
VAGDAMNRVSTGYILNLLDINYYLFNNVVYFGRSNYPLSIFLENSTILIIDRQNGLSQFTKYPLSIKAKILAKQTVLQGF